VAAGGTRNDAAFAELRALLAPRADGRSLGTGDEFFAWVDRHTPHLAPADLLATATDATGEAIGSALVSTGAAGLPLSVDIRGTAITLHLVKPPFVPLKKNS
jgi:hypothetical protein